MNKELEKGKKYVEKAENTNIKSDRGCIWAFQDGEKKQTHLM